MSADKDNDLWDGIEDAFSPDVDEMRQAEKDLAKVQPEPAMAAPQGAVIAPRPATRRNLIALAATVLLLVGAIAWIGDDVVNQKLFDEMVTADQAVLGLQHPADQDSWVYAMGFATKRIRSGLRTLARVIADDSQDPTVTAAAQDALQRLRSGDALRLGDGSYDTKAMHDTMMSPEASVEAKLQAIENLEALTDRLVSAVRSANPSIPGKKELTVWRIKHWLVDPMARPPKMPQADQALPHSGDAAQPTPTGAERHQQ